MQFNRKKYSDEILLQLYRCMLKSRMIEEKMLVLLRQNKISKWFSGIGQEGISVGVTNALQHDEWVFQSHRNLGLFVSRNVPFDRLLAQWQGKANGFSKGRERSFHFGCAEYFIGGMISHMAANLSVAAGVGLGNLLNRQSKVAVVFCGDGATSEGDFHEAINLAAVWRLPVVFVVENNGYALSTPVAEQFNCSSLVDKGPGYGIDALQIDGNNVLEVYDTVLQLVDSIRLQPRPVLLETVTFRMRGHEEASGTKYVPEDLFDVWMKKDPINTFEKYLLEEKILSEKLIKSTRDQFTEEIEDTIEFVFHQPDISPKTNEELNDIYARSEFELVIPDNNLTEKRYVDAISDGLTIAMEKYPNLVLMGQDIAEYGGVFKITEGFLSKFGKERVRNTPLCESAIVGASLGLSMTGIKAVVEMQFSDFVTCGFNQIVNNLAKSFYRWQQKADVVIRMPSGAGVGAGPFHSQSTEAWFFHVPGLKIVYPSSVYDAKGLLLSAIEDPNPVLFFEHKALYRKLKDEIPVGYYNIEIGKAAIVKQGNEVTVITYGMGVHWAVEASTELGIDAEILDLRTLLPWDKSAIEAAVKKTGRVLLLTEDTLQGSIIAEIAAWIGETCFQYLDAPVLRAGSLDTPVPFAIPLEENFLPFTSLKSKLQQLCRF